MDNNKAYRIVSCGKKSSRRDYSKVSGKLELPNLVEIQTDSFKWFTQQGIQEVFEEIYPKRMQLCSTSICRYGIGSYRLRNWGSCN